MSATQPADAELSRPSPEALLAAAAEHRGRLKIFLGAAPGVFPDMFKLAIAAIAAAALAVPSVAGAAPYHTGVNPRAVELDGIDREYLVYVPERRAADRVPVVFMFHGSSGDGEQFLNGSGWREQADREGFVAVFPTGLRYRVLDSGLRVTK